MDTTNSITIPDSDSIMTTSTSPATAALVKTIEISLKGLHQNQRTALLLYITRHEIDNGFACDCQGSEHSYLVRYSSLRFTFIQLTLFYSNRIAQNLTLV
jgi:hypothetical protein